MKKSSSLSKNSSSDRDDYDTLSESEDDLPKLCNLNLSTDLKRNSKNANLLIEMKETIRALELKNKLLLKQLAVERNQNEGNFVWLIKHPKQALFNILLEYLYYI